MKPDVNKIIKAMEDEMEKALKEQKYKEEEIINNADIIICITVSNPYDHYSLADRIKDILDDIPAVEDSTIFIK